MHASYYIFAKKAFHAKLQLCHSEQKSINLKQIFNLKKYS